MTNRSGKEVKDNFACEQSANELVAPHSLATDEGNQMKRAVVIFLLHNRLLVF